MTRTTRHVLLAGIAIFAGACAEALTSSFGTQMLDAAFNTTPLGFESAVSSFAGSGAMGMPFLPGDRSENRGANFLGGGHDFMGGGFGIEMLGGELGGPPPFERGGPNATSASCTYNATSGVNTCTDTHNGVTVTRTIVYKTAAGTAQAKQDSTTNSIATHVDATGTLTRRNGATTNVANSSDRLVTGLAAGSTQRTVNGTSKGNETSTGKDTAGTFTVVRAIGDTTSGVVIPVAGGKQSYPTAGKVIRQMTVTVTYTGKTPVVSTRREVITYDGSATATETINHNGTTKTCTIPLPRGRPNCG